MATEEPWERWSALTGIVFVALLVALSFSAEAPENASAESLARFYAEQGEGAIVLQYFLVGLAGAALLWFAGTLRARLRRAEGDPGRLSAVVFGAGAATAILLLVAGSHFIAPPAAVNFENPRVLDPVLDNVVGTAGFIALNFGLVASAVMFTATGLVALRTRILPAWYAWAGFVVSLALVVNIFYFLGFYLWLAWILVTSVLLLMPPGKPARRTRRTSTARRS